MAESVFGESATAILIPVFNDWEPLRLLLRQIRSIVEPLDRSFEILVVDDGSTEPVPDDLFREPSSRIRSVDVLTLRRNLGHQRAIAVGLSFIEDKRPCDAVVVLDGDGEDAPSDIPLLLAEMERAGGRTIVFAERVRRTERVLFRLGYRAYKATHLLLTGIAVRVGNFSAVPRPALSRLVVLSDLWNHYAAAVFEGRVPFTSVPTRRAPRLAGTPRMSFLGLVTHGLSAISVFSGRVGVRISTAVFLAASLASAAVLALAVSRAAGGPPPPRGIVWGLGLTVVLLWQLFALFFVFTLLVLGGRNRSGVLPKRDYGYFIESTWRAWPRRE